MDNFLIFFFVISVPLVLAQSFRAIAPNKIGIVKRMGKYHRTIQPGITFIIPFIEMMYFIDTKKEQTISTHFHSLMTQDAIVIKLDIEMTYHIENTRKINYDAIKLDSILKTLVLNSLMSFIQQKDFHEIKEKQQEITKAFHNLLTQQISEWGLVCDSLKLYNTELK